MIFIAITPLPFLAETSTNNTIDLTSWSKAVQVVSPWALCLVRAHSCQDRLGVQWDGCLGYSINKVICHLSPHFLWLIRTISCLDERRTTVCQ